MKVIHSYHGGSNDEPLWYHGVSLSHYVEPASIGVLHHADHGGSFVTESRHFSLFSVKINPQNLQIWRTCNFLHVQPIKNRLKGG